MKHKEIYNFFLAYIGKISLKVTFALGFTLHDSNYGSTKIQINK